MFIVNNKSSNAVITWYHMVSKIYMKWFERRRNFTRIAISVWPIFNVAGSPTIYMIFIWTIWSAGNICFRMHALEGRHEEDKTTNKECLSKLWKCIGITTAYYDFFFSNILCFSGRLWHLVIIRIWSSNAFIWAIIVRPLADAKLSFGFGTRRSDFGQSEQKKVWITSSAIHRSPSNRHDANNYFALNSCRRLFIFYSLL